MLGWLQDTRWVLAGMMTVVGIAHFVWPEPFERIVPKKLPAPRALVYISGAFEILGGVGLVLPYAPKVAAWGLIALLVAVFPANINMAVNDLPLGTKKLPRWVHWVRLPLQAVLVAWAFAFT